MGGRRRREPKAVGQTGRGTRPGSETNKGKDDSYELVVFSFQIFTVSVSTTLIPFSSSTSDTFISTHVLSCVKSVVGVLRLETSVT